MTEQNAGAHSAPVTMKMDLHMHTSFSDGELTPKQLVAYARKRDVRYIAITDHDTTDGCAQAYGAGREQGVEVLAGIEISADSPFETHILGLGIDPENEALNKALRRFIENRRRRNEKMLDKLAEHGIVLENSELTQYGTGETGRTHFARLMAEKGICSSVDEAFEKYLSAGCPTYVPNVRMEPAAAIELILNAGGMPVLAHPLTSAHDLDKLYENIKLLKDYGLCGLECYYPAHDTKDTNMLCEYALKLGLYITCGSDFHGKYRSQAEIGYNVTGNKYLYDTCKKLYCL